MNYYRLNPNQLCNKNCGCDYVKYNPVCSEEGITYISPCHAGCKQEEIRNGTKLYSECSCVKQKIIQDEYNNTIGGIAYPGSCSVDCSSKFFLFVAMMCIVKFSSATGKASNFLVTVR